MSVSAYIRVSTLEQDLEVQREAILKWAEARGVKIEKWFEDKMTGGTLDRPGLIKLLQEAESGKINLVIVFDLTRLGRSLRDIVRVAQRFKELGVRLVSVKDGLDTTNQLLYDIFTAVIGALAEAERKLIRERTIEGLIRAKSIGKRLGRKPRVDLDKLVTLMKAGFKIRQIAEILGVHPSTIYRSLKKLRENGLLIETKEVKIVEGGGVKI